MKQTALVRSVPRSYDRCLREKDVPIDVQRAHRQHADYVAAIRAADWAVVMLPTLDDAPDSVFVEDPAVVFSRHLLLARVGAESRRVEGASIARLMRGFEQVNMEAPATLDGGDVLRVDSFVFVGISARTNQAGFEVFASTAREEGLEPVAVPLRDGLHLKSVCSRVGKVVIGRFDAVDRAPFAERGISTLDAPEPWGANVLDLGETVLVSASAPSTAALLGPRARMVDVSEFHKGDGALTCLSIRVRPGGQ